MSARYGERGRSSEPVSDSGRRVVTSRVKEYYREVFTTPGTWTKPANASFVDVTVVGGGGGNSPNGGSGGGGRVLYEYGVPVAGPVPVTVGSAGTVASLPNSWTRTAGGTSAFGPTASPVPSLTIQAGGGGSGGILIAFPTPTPQQPGVPTVPVNCPGQDAPPIGGSGGGGGQYSTSFYPGGIGVFGYPGTAGTVASAPLNIGPTTSYGGGATSIAGGYLGNSPLVPYPTLGNPIYFYKTGKGLFGFGHGGGNGVFESYDQGYNAATPTTSGNFAYYGKGGSAGIVIVEWWE